MEAERTRGPAFLATVVALPIALVVGAVVFWLLRPGVEDERQPDTGPVRVDTPPSLAEATVPCQGLLARLPSTLDGNRRRPVSADAERVTAWGDPPIVLRCGVAKPAALTSDAQLLGVNGVEWVADERTDEVVWTTTGLRVYVELRIPRAYREKAATRILNPLAKPLKDNLS